MVWWGFDQLFIIYSNETVYTVISLTHKRYSIDQCHRGCCAWIHIQVVDRAFRPMNTIHFRKSLTASDLSRSNNGIGYRLSHSRVLTKRQRIRQSWIDVKRRGQRNVNTGLSTDVTEINRRDWISFIHWNQVTRSVCGMCPCASVFFRLHLFGLPVVFIWAFAWSVVNLTNLCYPSW